MPAAPLRLLGDRRVPCGLLRFADDGRLLGVNDELLALLGRSREDLETLRFPDLLSPGARLYAEVVMLPLLRIQARVDEVELVLRNGDGRDLHVLASATRWTGDAEGINDLALMPLRQRRQMEDQLLQARRTADQLPGVLFSLLQGPGASLRLEYASRGLTELTGLDPAALATDATPLLAALHPEDGQRFGSCLRPGPERFAPRPLTLRLAGPAGTRWVRMHAKGEPLPGGQVAWRGALYDVTDQQQLDERLRDHDKLQAITQLAAGVAHDFNNLLGSMIGLAELCQADATPGSRQLRNLGRIVDAGEKAAALVRQLLDFARQTPQRLETVSLAQLVERCRALLAAGLPLGVCVAIRVDEDCRVEVDQAQLEQCLLNLVNNAAYAMRRGGGQVRLTVDVIETPPDLVDAGHATPRMARLRIADSGEGIPPELLSKIFEPFFTTKPVGEGTGLGLAAVHGIVAHHGGQVLVQSEPGAGTVVSVLLPPAPPAREPTPSPLPQDPTS
ncbi:ATP-binding protein [Aquabacterium sp. A7-Y]|uniref:ATP-binding protein n=1 Tax=Aquabacterium sp. A7-Y TaxID=1349605 RepID=UPI00223E0D54|nr:ATP-binding protein [Aquabacterium sp. A7-Y]MCW7541921.1 ATP-binding protein [Aquabacterium sp. A7-Y]